MECPLTFVDGMAKTAHAAAGAETKHHGERRHVCAQMLAMIKFRPVIVMVKPVMMKVFAMIMVVMMVVVIVVMAAPAAMAAVAIVVRQAFIQLERLAHT